jgi:hypothetical protein
MLIQSAKAQMNGASEDVPCSGSERPAGEWSDVATAMTSEITLNSQPRAKEFEYRVLAINKAGEGEASNSVMAVL